jgi:WD40 repeat protein
MKSEVFISYASKDKNTADAICMNLESKGVKCWIAPRDILPGREWPNEIVKAISACKILVLVFSNFSNESAQTRREIDCAINYEKIIIPFRVKNIEPVGSMKYYLGDLHWLDAYTSPLEKHIDKLFSLINSFLASKEQEPSPLKRGSKRQPLLPINMANRNNRQAMLNLMLNYWIKGVYEQSLVNSAFIEIRMERDDLAVEQPWEKTSSNFPQLRVKPTAKVTIEQAFNQASQSLLVLGEPGSVKTTVMLEFARKKILEAEKDESKPIPVVFNLSSWSEKKLELSQWMIAELNYKYYVPLRLAQQWVNEDQIFPFLDGLDEVKESSREDCIRTINRYRREHGFTPIFICSRKADYECLATRLRLHGAVVLKPLSKEQVHSYIAKNARNPSSFLKLLNKDPSMEELVNVPLFLRVLLSTQEEIDSSSLHKIKSTDERRKKILDLYVNQMISRKRLDKKYAKGKINRWLSFLAQGMNQHGQTIFHIEHLQPSWLTKTLEKLEYVFLTRFAGSILLSIAAVLLFLSGNTTSLQGRIVLSLVLITLAVIVTAIESLRLIARKESTSSDRGFVRALKIIGFIIIFAITPWFAVKWNTSTGYYASFTVAAIPIFGLVFGLRTKRKTLKEDIRNFGGFSLRTKRIWIILSVGIFLSLLHYSFFSYMSNRMQKTYGLMPAIQLINPDLGTQNIISERTPTKYPPKISTDGKRIYLLLNDETFKILGEDGMLLKKFQNRVISFDLSPDGERLATTGANRVADIWDGAGNYLASLTDAADWISFSPDGKLILSGKLILVNPYTYSKIIGPVKMWSQDGTFLSNLDGSLMYLGWTVTGDEYRFVTSSDAPGKNRIQMWDENGTLINSIDDLAKYSDPYSIAYNADSTIIASIMKDGSVHVWDGDGQPMSVIQENDQPFTKAEMDQFHPRILTSSLHKVSESSSYTGYQLWDVNGRKIGFFESTFENFIQANFNSAGDLIIAAYDAHKDVGKYSLKIWDINGNFKISIPNTTKIYGEYRYPDGETYYITQSDKGNITVWNSNWESAHTILGEPRFSSRFLSLDGTKLVTLQLLSSGSFETLGNRLYALKVWDIPQEKEIYSQQGLVNINESPQAIFTPLDGIIIASAPSNTFKELSLFWLALAAFIALFMGFRAKSIELTLSPNEGIRRTTAYVIRFGLITFMLSALLVASFFFPAAYFAGDSLINTFVQYWDDALVSLISFCIPIMFGYGGMEVINHFTLRYILWRKKLAPWRYDRFLEDMKNAVLVKRVGGGYIFLHRILQDYFASIETVQ